MKNDLCRWFTVFMVLMIIMSFISFFAFLINPLILYFETGRLNIMIIDNFLLSIQIGSFVGGVVVIGLWIKYRFNIH